MSGSLTSRPGGPQADLARRLDGPIHLQRHVRVVCIGAGASGLLLAYKLQRHFDNFSLTVYEKNEDISGTWWENRYPGCACDVPAHNYTYSFEPKLDWSAVYVSSKEIYDYFSGFSKKYQLGKYVKTSHQVIGAYWNKEKNGWDVKVKDVKRGVEVSDFCDILINAGGILNNWRWPAIPGFERYKGPCLHTANWDDSVKLEGKHVGLIGNGSSGVQVLPTIQPVVNKLTTFIREPTWISPVQGLEQHVYTEQEKHDFANKPDALLEYRKTIERGMNGVWELFMKGTEVNSVNEKWMKDQMATKLKDPSLAEKLIPKWSVGCRRITPGVGYLEALVKENVQVVYGEITEITEKGCVCDDGKEYPVDVLICATGFDTTFKPRFPIVNPDGRNLQDIWAKDPEGYLGIAAAEFPNYFFFLGPSCPIGNGPVLSALEVQADYMLRWIDRYQTHNISTFAPTVDAVKDFAAHRDWFMPRMVWTEDCRSWYKARQDGPVTALWPGSAHHYTEALRELRFEDWDIKYVGNRFAWLGNGYSQMQMDPTAEWGYYIRDKDDDELISRGRRNKLLTKSGTRVENHSGWKLTGAVAGDSGKVVSRL